ncbi:MULTISPECIES: AEC family transporter [Actinoalloteichus]|uniref:Permease n=1 Tax=Actinoalloteichus fjordicus TaxID=1612552 RepID=A0AAC9LDL1_9PSEU|nr:MULTISPECIES: AEC family transporter [Actinoalloteichus]APU14919.1 putative permease [Actinoalloteichus fjordicus]APU20989.1 putative permease [Actinoalloteichus sp. GBA129-24]
MNGVIEGFFVIGAVILVGYLVGRTGVLGPSATQVLSRTSFFVATPALLFVTLARADVGAVLSSALLVTGVTSSLACLLYVPVGMLRRRPGGETAIGSMAAGYVNAGNLGLPIAAYALGDAAEMAPILLFQLGVLTPVFTTVLDILSERANGTRPALLRTVTAPLRNPIAVATAAGLIVSATGFIPPEPVMAPIELLANLAVPGMLLAFGISLRGAALPGRSKEIVPSLVAVVVIKNLVHPLLALLLGLLLGLEGHALLAVVVCAALPSAQNVFGYAVRFDQGVALARESALTTTILSLPVLFLVVALLA